MNRRRSPGRAPRNISLNRYQTNCYDKAQRRTRPAGCLRSSARPIARVELKQMITLGGGSLGSCVDEERSQLRELM